jgi:hypothetical protein
MKFSVLAFFLVLVALGTNAQETLHFTIPPQAVSGNSSAQIYSVNIPDRWAQRSFSLTQIDGSNQMAVPFQLEGNELFWKVNKEYLNKFLSYKFKDVTSKSNDSNLNIKKEDGQLAIYQKGNKLLGYQTDLKEAPEGINPIYGRSGFIHPLNTPSGKRLTRIQPKDHFHHYGVWNPWTHTLYKGDTLDFWNLNKGEGTVRYAKTIHTLSGPVFSEYQVLQEHVVLKDGANETALNETQTVRIYPIDENSYIADFTIQYNCASENPFTILEYRYAGFGWRTTEEWDNKNSHVLTSEGLNRKRSDGSTARWCIVEGKLGDGTGGAVMMSHPSNFNHPEPLRIWPENQYGRGDMFANFAPTKTSDWNLIPGKNYTLKYRMLVYDGKMTAQKAENAWQSFAQPIKIEIK